jgi:hypothetical protein
MRPKYPRPRRLIPTTRREQDIKIEGSDVDLQVKYSSRAHSNERDCCLSFNFKGTRSQVDKLFMVISRSI